MPDYLPEKDILEQLIAFTQKVPEAATYFAERFKKLLEEQKLQEKFADLLEALETVALAVSEKSVLHAGDPWGGGVVKTAEEWQQLEQQEEQQEEVLEDEAASDALDINCVIEVSDEGDFERFYTDSLEQSAHDEMDELIQQWLVENNLALDEGKIYEVNEQNEGQILSAEECKTRFQAVDKGLSRYVSENIRDKNYRFNLEMQVVQPKKIVKSDLNATQDPDAQTTPGGGNT